MQSVNDENDSNVGSPASSSALTSSPRRRLPDPAQGRLLRQISEQMEKEVKERIQVRVVLVYASLIYYCGSCCPSPRVLAVTSMHS